MAGLLFTLAESRFVLLYADTEARALRITELAAVIYNRWGYSAHLAYLNFYGAPVPNIDHPKLLRLIFNLAPHSPSAHTSPPCLRWAARAASMRCITTCRAISASVVK